MHRKTLAIVSSAAIGAVLLGLASPAVARRGDLRGGATVTRGGTFASVRARPGGAVGIRPPIASGRPGWNRPGVGWAGGWRPGVGWGWGGGWGWPGAGAFAAASNPCWRWNGFSWVNTCNQWSSNWW